MAPKSSFHSLTSPASFFLGPVFFSLTFPGVGRKVEEPESGREIPSMEARAEEEEESKGLAGALPVDQMLELGSWRGCCCCWEGGGC